MIVFSLFSTSTYAGSLYFTGESTASLNSNDKRSRIATVGVAITPEARTVKEGESVKIKIHYTGLDAGAEYCIVKVDTSIALQNGASQADYTMRTQNNASNRDDYLILDATANDGVDPNEAIKITFTPRVVKGSCVLSSTSPTTININIVDIAATSTQPLTISLLANASSRNIAKGSGNTKVASIKFALPSGKQADRNCIAAAWVTVVGGTAKRGQDFNFPSSFRVNFDHTDGNSKIQDVNLDVLAGIAGNGDKTVEMRADFSSFGGSAGNSCPLKGASSKKILITLKDTTPTAPTVSISANPSSAKAGETVNVRYGFSGNFSTCTAVHPTVLMGKNAISIDENINVLKQRDVPVKIKASITKETKVILGAKAIGCKLANSNATASIIIPKKADSTKPIVSMSVISSPVKVGKSINIIYKVSGNVASCTVIKPVLVGGSGYARLKNPNMNLRGKKQATVTVDILKQDAQKEINVVLGVKTEGCTLANNTTTFFKIPKQGSATTTTTKESSENIRESTCDALRKIQLTPTQKSYFKAQCENVGTEAKNNANTEEVTVQAIAVLSAAGRQLQNVRSRLTTLRATRGRRGIDVSGATLNVQGSTVSVGLLGGAAGDDENGLLENSRWGFFANGDYTFGDENRENASNALKKDRNFDFSSTGLTFGADYRFPGDKKYAGVALGYKDFTSDFTSQKGGTDVKGYNLSVYGTYLLSDQAYLDATIGYGKNNIDSRRPAYKDVKSGKTIFAIGKPDAKELTFSVGGGYELYKGEWSLTPYGRMDYIKSTIDAYKETSDKSAQPSLFSFGKQSIKALTSTLGIKTSRSLSTSKGVFVPYASLEWKHEFKGRGAIIGTHILTGKQNSVGEASKFDRNYFNLGVGVSAQFPKGKSAFLSLESRQGDSVVKDNAVRAGFRWEF